MKKRWLLQVSVIIVLGLTGVVSYQWWIWWTGPRNKINQETVEQIRTGMTLAVSKRLLAVHPVTIQDRRCCPKQITPSALATT
jgi:hypothetical protein